MRKMGKRCPMAGSFGPRPINRSACPGEPCMSLCLSVLALSAVLTILGPAWPRRATAAPPPVVFHVATTGNDHAPGTREQPFATLERAQAALRALKRQPGGLRQPVTILVQDGTYRLATPLVLTPEDSGTADSPVT